MQDIFSDGRMVLASGQDIRMVLYEQQDEVEKSCLKLETNILWFVADGKKWIYHPDGKIEIGAGQRRAVARRRHAGLDVVGGRARGARGRRARAGRRRRARTGRARAAPDIDRRNAREHRAAVVRGRRSRRVGRARRISGGGGDRARGIGRRRRARGVGGDRACRARRRRRACRARRSRCSRRTRRRGRAAGGDRAARGRWRRCR